MKVVSLFVEACFSFQVDWALSFLMKLRLLSWNVRNLNNSHKRELVKYWLHCWKCDVVCL